MLFEDILFGESFVNEFFDGREGGIFGDGTDRGKIFNVIDDAFGFLGDTLTGSKDDTGFSGEGFEVVREAEEFNKKDDSEDKKNE